MVQLPNEFSLEDENPMIKFVGLSQFSHTYIPIDVRTLLIERN